MFSIPFTVQKSIAIEKSPDEVFSALGDFQTWPHWSPWLCQERDCKVTIDGEPGSVGHNQAWEGDFIGSGNMRLAAVDDGKRLDYDLNFLKPWKSQSEAGFSVAAEADGTRVEWYMKGSLPFFLFFMKKMMSAWVGSDYDRGLAMLKELLETGSVPSATTVKGVSQQDGFHYLGKRRSCSMNEMGSAMEQDFTELGRRLDASELREPEQVLSIYHKFNMVKGTCEYTSGFGYTSKPDPVEGMDVGQLPEHRALRVEHVGPYRHVGNAWAASMGCARAKHKLNKSLPMYEVYANDPHETPEEEIEVSIYVPVKR